MLPELCVALPHADYVNIEDLLVYLHWDVIIPTWNFELSMLVTALLDKGLVNYVLIRVTCFTAMVRERTCLPTRPPSALGVWILFASLRREDRTPLTPSLDWEINLVICIAVIETLMKTVDISLEHVIALFANWTWFVDFQRARYYKSLPTVIGVILVVTLTVPR